MLFGKFHADSLGSGVLYKNPTSPTSSLLSFFSFSSLFSFTFLFYKAINEHYHIHPLTLGKAQTYGWIAINRQNAMEWTMVRTNSHNKQNRQAEQTERMGRTIATKQQLDHTVGCSPKQP